MLGRLRYCTRLLATSRLAGVARHRRCFSGDVHLLKLLEREANMRPSDVRAQINYFRELSQRYPEHAIRRYESGRFAESGEIVADYLKSLSRTGRLDTLPSSKVVDLMERSSTSAVAPSASEAVASHVNPQLESLQRTLANNSAKRPLQVAVKEEGMKSQFWKTVRSLGGMFLFITGIGAIMDSAGGFGGKSHMFSEVRPNTNNDQTFADVKGCSEAKEELKEIVDFLRDPSKFTRLGGKLPKGVLLMGAPGTGKTLLARAVAGEAGVPFFYCSGSEFEEMYVGVGARRVRELFAAAKKSSPCIIFIDEVDAIGGTRKLKDHQAMRMTLNQLLVEMDGFNPNDSIIVIGATNFPELLDKALVRPGRFDRQVVVPLPDLNGRKEILDLYVKKIQCAEDVDTLVLARGTPGCSGAQLDNLVNMAAIKASQEGKPNVSMREFEYAKDKILMGAERKSAVIEEAERKLTAYHEGGHALVALYTDGAHPIHKATILPRGQALGMVHLMPDKDEYSVSRRQLLAQLDVCMGGRIAEQMIFGDENVTTGASSDLKSATRIATNMVIKWGMSERLGLVDHEEREISQLSSETRLAIDEEIRLLLENARQRACSLLKSREQELHLLASALLEHETLSRQEIQDVLSGKQLPRNY